MGTGETMGRATRTPYQVTFLVLISGIAAYSLLQSLVTPALPTIQRDLHASQGAVTWLVTAYLLAASVCTPILGRIGDVFGKERMLVVTLTALALGTGLAAVAHNITLLIVARLIQGAGGGVLPLAFGIMRDEFPREKVAGAIGLSAAILAVGGGLGITIAGPIVAHLDYHWLFIFPLFILVPAIVATHLFVPESPVQSKGTVSIPGALLLSGWLVSLLLAISQGSSWGWTSAGVLGLLAAAVVIGIVWVRVEYRSKVPLVDMQMMRQPAVWTTNLSAFLLGVAMYSVGAFLPSFMQTPSSAGYGFGASVQAVGLLMLPSSITMFVIGLAMGRITTRYGSKLPLMAGCCIAALAFVLMATVNDHAWQMCVETGLMGLGIGTGFSALSTLVVDSVPDHQTGVASGMNANIRTIGGSIGSQVCGSLITATIVGSALPKESGYVAAFLFLGVAALLAGAAAGFVPRPHPHTHLADDPVETEARADYLGGGVPVSPQQAPA
jgi:EmrB/QacA subfamily drug resistance transporter